MADIQWAIIMYRDALYIAKQTGDKVAMGRANRNLGNSYYLDGKFEDAIYYHRQDLEMAKELGDTEGEGIAYGNLGNVYFSQLEDFPEAIACYEKCLRVAVDAGNRAEEGKASYGLGCIYEFLRCLDQALKLFRRSLKAFDDIRSHGHLNDERKINVQDEYKLVIIGLWRVLLKQGKISEALSVAERGRVQALIDLMRATYGVETGQSGCDGNRREITPDTSFQEDSLSNLLSYLPSKSTTLFLAIDKKEINIWVLTAGHVHFRKSEIGERCLVEGDPLSFDSLTRAAHPLTKNEILKQANYRKRKAEQIEQDRVESMNKALRILYDVVISKVEDLLTGEELVFVPDGPLCIAPFAAFLNSKSSRLSESFRIRVIPSLTSLKLIRDATEYHSENESILLVGNPNLAKLPEDWPDLPGAEEEVETIGKMFNIEPLIGEAATKEEVLSRLNSAAALIHIAAHGKNGKILLTPNPTRASQPPKEEDYMLTMADVAATQLHAVVVLSNCHSGQGKITSEGAVGIARGFLAAGARCVLVSLWEIDDEITLKFMKFFYEQLMLGKKAGEALNHAMKYIKESNDYVQDWAAFQLIGDDVPLEFAKKQ